MIKSLKQMSAFLTGEYPKIYLVAVFVLINTGIGVITPYIISKSVDDYIIPKNLNGLPSLLFFLGFLYLINMATSLLQTKIIGNVSLRTLYRIRQKLFNTLQSLPLSFFSNQKAGDLTSRLNSDTDKINSFLSESVVRFVGLFFQIIGVGFFMFWVNWQMALITLSSCIGLVITNLVISKYATTTNKSFSKKTGELSAQLQDDLSNYKAIYAFNRQQFMVNNLERLNMDNYNYGTRATVATGIFNPAYTFVGNLAQVLVLAGGLWLISSGTITLGVLIGFIVYAQKFYDPLRIVGSIWGTMQSAIASWSRIQEILDAN